MSCVSLTSGQQILFPDRHGPDTIEPVPETDVPLSDALRALGLPPDASVTPAAGGASGSAWRVSLGAASYVLRFERSIELTDARVAAITAARSAELPAPALVRRAHVGDHEAILLSWLPGMTLLDAISRAPASTAKWGMRMGAMQRRLHAVAAPIGLPAAATDAAHPFVAGRAVPDLPDGDRLLHLDWHPLNLIVEPERGEITGIVDWDNARAGHPLLDLARTESMMTLDPGVAGLPHDMRARLAGFVGAWADGYGPDARAIPPACRAWAAHVMLADLEPRYRATPSILDPIRRAIAAVG